PPRWGWVDLVGCPVSLALLVWGGEGVDLPGHVLQQRAHIGQALFDPIGPAAQRAEFFAQPGDLLHSGGAVAGQLVQPPGAGVLDPFDLGGQVGQPQHRGHRALLLAAIGTGHCSASGSGPASWASPRVTSASAAQARPIWSSTRPTLSSPPPFTVTISLITCSPPR